jgi:maleate isomerase
MEHEFNVMRPREATVHVARMRLKEVTLSKLMGMEREIEAAALRLADAKVDVIGFGCTSGSLFRGLGHDQEIVTRIEKAVDTPAVATAGAVVNALKVLNLSRISVATPYTAEINSLEKRFLEENGFVIQEMKGLGIEDNLKIGEQSPRTVYDLVKKVDTAWNDGIFVSCTNLKTIEVIGRLEEELKKPVISSNTATLWAVLRKVKYEEPVIGWGRLLTML